MENDVTADVATPRILNTLLLVSGLSLHDDPPAPAELTADQLTSCRQDFLRYNWCVGHFCWAQATRYLTQLETLEGQRLSRDFEALRDVTAALIKKASHHFTCAGQTVAHDVSQLHIKLGVARHLMDRAWEDLDQFWPEVILSLVDDVDHWTENAAARHCTLQDEALGISRINHAAKHCNQYIQRHARLMKHLYRMHENSLEAERKVLAEQIKTFSKIRSTVEKLSEIAAMSFKDAQIKSDVLRTLLRSEMRAFDTLQLELAKSYCDDLWWLLSQLNATN